MFLRVQALHFWQKNVFKLSRIKMLPSFSNTNQILEGSCDIFFCLDVEDVLFLLLAILNMYLALFRSANSSLARELPYHIRFKVRCGNINHLNGSTDLSSIFNGNRPKQ